MRTRLAVLLGLLAVVLLVSVVSLRRSPESTTTVERFDPAAMQRRPPERRLLLWLAKDASGEGDLQVRLENAYRVPADRRFAGAVREIQTIVSPAVVAPEVHVEWNTDHWEVSAAGSPVGALSGFPTFREGLALAESAARARLAAAPWPRGAGLDEARAFVTGYRPEQALALIDDQVRRDGVTVTAVTLAADACSQLAFLLGEDRSCESDTTMARAIALLALARAAGAGPQPRIATRLAWAMGYGEEAATLAQTLPADDALRAYVQGERASLLTPVAATEPERRVLQRMALAECGDRDGWVKVLQGLDPLPAPEVRPALATALAFRRFDIARWLGPQLLEAAMLGMPDIPNTVAPDSATLRSFERGMARPEIAARGPLTGGAIAAMRQALFMSGMLVCHDFLATTLASPDAMRGWHEDLATSHGAAATRFASWELHLASAIDAPDQNAPLWEDLADPALPAPCALRTFRMLAPRLRLAWTDERAALRLLLGRLDTRPSWMSELAIAAQEHAQWPELTEHLLTQGATSTPGGNPSRALLAVMQGDVARLNRIIDDPRTDPDEARRALRMWIESDSSMAEALTPALARVVARTPRNWWSVSDLVHLLEARGRHREAEARVLRWCAEVPDDADVLDSTVAVTFLARLQREQGHVEQALRTMGDLERGMQRAAMTEKATLLAMSGHMREALEIARRITVRYPQVREAAALPAILQWRAGRMDDAARAAVRLSEDDQGAWNALAVGFADTFRGRTAPMREALAALRKQGASYHTVVWHLSNAFENAGDHATASKLALEATPGNGLIRGFGVARIHRMLTAGSGPDVARDWLAKQHMDEGARCLAGLLLTLQGSSEGAWQLAARGDTEYDWVLRAAAWRMGGSLAGPQADTLRQHLASPADERYRPMLRYLMNEFDEGELLALARDPRRCAETWFFCGVRAFSEGRSRDAMRWFNLCQETGSINDAEVIASHASLSDWSTKLQTAERMLALKRRPV